MAEEYQTTTEKVRTRPELYGSTEQDDLWLEAAARYAALIANRREGGLSLLEFGRFLLPLWEALPYAAALRRCQEVGIDGRTASNAVRSARRNREANQQPDEAELEALRKTPVEVGEQRLLFVEYADNRKRLKESMEHVDLAIGRGGVDLAKLNDMLRDFARRLAEVAA
jgi:hypothetical protein